MKRFIALLIFWSAVSFGAVAESVSWCSGLFVSVPCLSGQALWNGSDISYGISLNSGKYLKNFPIQAKWGKLSAGGGLSKLNNPLISSSVSPFSSATSYVSPVTASFSSSFNKTDSLFFQAGYKDAVKLSCFLLPDGNLASSATSSVRLSKNNRLSVSFSYGNFWRDDNKSDSWFNQTCFYHGERSSSFLSQVLFSGKSFSTLMSSCFYESVNGGFVSVWKTENKIKAGKFVFSTSAFFNPYAFQSDFPVTASGKIIDEIFQAKGGVLYQFRFGKKVPVFWKIGTSCFYSMSMFEEDVFKVSSGVNFLCYLTSASITAQADFSDFDFLKATAVLSNKWFFNSVQPGIKCSVSANKGKNSGEVKWNEDVAVNVNLFENPAFTFQTGASFAESCSFNLSASCSFMWKGIRCYGTLEFSTNFH